MVKLEKKRCFSSVRDRVWKKRFIYLYFETLQNFNGRYTPVGKVLYGIEAFFKENKKFMINLTMC